MRFSTKENWVELVMLARCILTIMATVIPAAAAELRPEEAKYLIAGKYFTYRCFDGTTGGGRINADGSVVGTIQPGGFGPTRVIGLPVGTVRVQSDSICASLPGASIQPCFTVTQTDSRSFRGTIAGLGFAYCDFVKESLGLQPTPRRQKPADAAKFPPTPISSNR
jgi:hypothetical protein